MFILYLLKSKYFTFLSSFSFGSGLVLITHFSGLHQWQLLRLKLIVQTYWGWTLQFFFKEPAAGSITNQLPPSPSLCILHSTLASSTFPPGSTYPCFWAGWMHYNGTLLHNVRLSSNKQLFLGTADQPGQCFFRTDNFPPNPSFCLSFSLSFHRWHVCIVIWRFSYLPLSPFSLCLAAASSSQSLACPSCLGINFSEDRNPCNWKRHSSSVTLLTELCCVLGEFLP